ncbi:sugar ABC transporter permease [Streptomyces sp. NPDC051907]|uniref:sugar ABC transporter permease n=1 Tax=Streptomyces sp. NPDC051907 TaxID=3155284 RepID=UPI00341AE5B5
MSGPADWAAPALDSVLDRVGRVHGEVGDRFPLFAEPGADRWRTTSRGSWTGGFWAGLLWLRARRTGAAADRAAAADCTRRLAPWTEADTAARGLVFWYGTALSDEAPARELRTRAADACVDAYDPELRLVPWGSAFGGPRLVARADAVPGLVPLLASAGPAAASVARAHLRTHLELCGSGGAFRFDPEGGWLPVPEPAPGWARGDAWLQLAAADAVHWLGLHDLADTARRLTVGPAVPAADAALPDGPRDTSAAAIAAVALLKLSEQDRALAVLEELVRSYLTADGRLLEGCYDLHSGTAVRHELVWGTYFLAYGLAVLTGLVDLWDA